VSATIPDFEFEDAQQLVPDLLQLVVGLLHAVGCRLDTHADVQEPKVADGLETGEAGDLVCSLRAGIQGD